jgi:KDO2-lipid IV(A) lauroyltransferase
MQRAEYLAFRLGLSLFPAVPFSILYGFSDLLAFLLFHVVRYRRKVTLQNLRSAFPDHSEKNIRQIAARSYRNLSDVLLESLKGFSMTKASILKRYRIINPESLDAWYKQGVSLIGVTAHYANWEWGAFAASLQLSHRPVAFYKPLSNPYIDRHMKNNRTQYGTIMRSIYQTSETFREFSDQTSLFLMVADQAPSNVNKAYRTRFLGRETTCLHGPENHAKNNNYPVIYFDIQRIKRGYYQIRIKRLIEHPGRQPEGAITRQYMQTLEEIIRQRPANWLWSHRRWKRDNPPIKPDHPNTPLPKKH